MVCSRIYHSLQLDICQVESNDIVYIPSPQQFDEKQMNLLENVSTENSVNIVVVSGFDWNDCMTPWPAENPFHKSAPFTGGAQKFLAEMESDLLFNLEHSMNLTRPHRYLVGISLSGLFALWSASAKELFDGIASISGSLWYEEFKEWFCNLEELYCDRYYLSLGANECKSRHKTVTSVTEDTEAVARHIRDLGKKVELVINGDSHFDNIDCKIADAIKAIKF